MGEYLGEYTSSKAAKLKRLPLDRKELAARGQPYEELDQMLIELLLGVRQERSRITH